MMREIVRPAFPMPGMFHYENQEKLHEPKTCRSNREENQHSYRVVRQ